MGTCYLNYQRQGVSEMYDPLHAITARPEFTQTTYRSMSWPKNGKSVEFRNHRKEVLKSYRKRLKDGIIFYSAPTIARQLGIRESTIVGYTYIKYAKKGRFLEHEYKEILEHFMSRK